MGLVTVTLVGLLGCGTGHPVTTVTTVSAAAEAAAQAAQAAQENTGYRAALERWEKTYFEPMNIGALYVHRDQAKTPTSYLALAQAYQEQVRTAWVAMKAFSPPAGIAQKHVVLVEAFGDEVKLLGHLIEAVQQGDLASFQILADEQYVADQRLQTAEEGLSPYLEDQASPSM